MPASPFQASGETSPGKNDDLPRTIAGSTPLPLGRRSFAVSGPLAPVRSASYPVPVRRLTGSFHASFSVRLTTNALRFPSVPATRFREDFHLQVIAHAGPTTKKSPPGQDLEGQERSRWGRVEKGATDPKWPLSSIYSGRTMSRCTSKGAEIMRSLRIREVFGVKLGMHQCILRRSANTPSTNTPFGGRQK